MTSRLPVFYRPEMSIATDSYSPSSAKPAAVVADWTGNRSESGEVIFNLPVDVQTFEPVTAADLCLVHDVNYVKGVLLGALPNGFGNHDPAVAQACLFTCGSMVAAARHALKHGGFACSPSSGFHHAGRAFGGKFCTFNGLMLAAMALVRDHGVKVGILDCDYHYGDGTANILDHLKVNVRNSIAHFTADEERISRNDSPKAWFDDWLAPAIASLERCDIVLYQAGADMHIDDPLGGLLDDAHMTLRDALVFRRFADAGIPVAWNLAGGYRRDESGTIAPVLRTHRTTARLAAEHHGFAMERCRERRRTTA